MQEQQQLTCSKPAQSNNIRSLEIIQQLESLRIQHAVVVEQLRNLHSEAVTVRQAKKADWHNLENQVVQLRNELESFKQSFALPLESAGFVFDSEATVNFFMLET